MTKAPYWTKQLELTEQMIELGVPMQPTKTDVINLRHNRQRIRIDVLGGSPEVSIFDLDPPGTGFMAWVSLTVLDGRFAISAFTLSVPWPTGPIFWLSDPVERRGPQPIYRFSGRGGPQFPRDDVLNHHVNLQRCLPRGKVLEGFLLAYTTAPIPKALKHGDHVVGNIGVVDQFEQQVGTAVEFWLDRSTTPTSLGRVRSAQTPPFAFPKADKCKT